MTTFGSVLACVALLGCDRASYDFARTTPSECTIDDDCGLMPAELTCCGECEPVPPFVAVPRTEIDALLIELETRCADHPPRCEPMVCETSPPGCEATATCLHGRCTVVQSSTCAGFLADGIPFATAPSSCALPTSLPPRS